MRRHALLATTLVAAVTAGIFFTRTADRVSTARPSPSPTTSVLGESLKPTQILCTPAWLRPIDPIVAAGQDPQVGGHLHDGFGNIEIEVYTQAKMLDGSAYADMITHNTSCVADDPKDKAGYWVMAMYRTADSVLIRPNPGTRVYYSKPASVDNTKKISGPIVAFPPDFRMIAGVSSAATPELNPLVKADRNWWFCYPVKHTGFGDPPISDCKKIGGHRLDMYIIFPSCWVGKGGDPAWRRNSKGEVIDSPDHRAHVAYPVESGGVLTCPASHPVALPQVKFQVIYRAFDGSLYFSSGPWWTLHGDFWNTWIQSRLEEIVALINNGG